MTSNPVPTFQPPAVALVESHTWVARRVGSKAWVPHHHGRLRALLGLFKLVQQRTRTPLPRIRFLVVLSDGRGTVSPEFDPRCTCVTEATCCEVNLTVARSMAPAAPVFATNVCRHSWDVSVPMIIDDLLQTSSARTVRSTFERWLAMGAVPFGKRTRKVFFVGDDKAYRGRALTAGRRAPDLFDVVESSSINATTRVPFDRHAHYQATVYAHGYHFNSVRMRRLALMGGVVIAEEGPCREWWTMRAKPWVHYVPTTETFSDLEARARQILAPSNATRAATMAQKLRSLGIEALSLEGLTGYIEALWREYGQLVIKK